MANLIWNANASHLYATIMLMFLHIIYIISYLTFNNPLDSVKIIFQPGWKNNVFSLDSSYFQKNNQSVRITTLRWYIHDLVLLTRNGSIIQGPKRHYLMDLAVPDSREVVFSGISEADVAEIRFKVGVDSMTQVQGALGDDLDPSEGMYWSWQSGYIHVKIEGVSNLSLSPGNQFIYHLGGYRHPNNSITSVNIPVNHHSKLLKIQMNMHKFIEMAGISEQAQVMSPSQRGMTLMKHFCEIFKMAVH